MPALTQAEIDELKNPNQEPRIAELGVLLKHHLRQRGSGIFKEGDWSVTKQLNEILQTEFAATNEECTKFYTALRNDREILKVTFPNGNSGKKWTVAYLGLSELGDDPISQTLAMVGSIRSAVSETVRIARDRTMRIPSAVVDIQKVVAKMHEVEWADQQHEDFEAYSVEVLRALGAITKLNRELKT